MTEAVEALAIATAVVGITLATAITDIIRRSTRIAGQAARHEQVICSQPGCGLPATGFAPAKGWRPKADGYPDRRLPTCDQHHPLAGPTVRPGPHPRYRRPTGKASRPDARQARTARYSPEETP